MIGSHATGPRLKLRNGTNMNRNVISDHVPKRSLRVPGPMPDSNMASASAAAAHRDRGLTLIRGFEGEEVVDCLAAPDQRRLAVRDEHRRRPWHAVVVRRHGQRV